MSAHSHQLKWQLRGHFSWDQQAQHRLLVGSPRGLSGAEASIRSSPKAQGSAMRIEGSTAGYVGPLGDSERLQLHRSRTHWQPSVSVEFVVLVWCQTLVEVHTERLRITFRGSGFPYNLAEKRGRTRVDTGQTLSGAD